MIPISDYWGIVTPIDDVASPAQLLMSRRLRSIIPTTEVQLLPEVLDPQKIMETLKQKYYFDQHIPHLPGLAEVDPGQRTQGKLVGNDGGKNCRNRKMLMKLSWTKLMYSLNYTLMRTFCRSLKKKLGEVFQWSQIALEGQIIHIWIITTIQQYIHLS